MTKLFLPQCRWRGSCKPCEPPPLPVLLLQLLVSFTTYWQNGDGIISYARCTWMHYFSHRQKLVTVTEQHC